MIHPKTAAEIRRLARTLAECTENVRKAQAVWAPELSAVAGEGAGGKAAVDAAVLAQAEAQAALESAAARAGIPFAEATPEFGLAAAEPAGGGLLRFFSNVGRWVCRRVLGTAAATAVGGTAATVIGGVLLVGTLAAVAYGVANLAGYMASDSPVEPGPAMNRPRDEAIAPPSTGQQPSTHPAVDAGSPPTQPKGRSVGVWKLDKVILYAENKEQAGTSISVWNQKSDIFWKTETLTPTSVTNQGRKYQVTGEFTPPPAFLEPGKPFDVTFRGRFSKSEEDVGWPGVLLDVMAGEASSDPKVRERMGFIKATIDGKEVPRVVFEVNPKRQSPTDRFTFTAPAAEDAERPLWRFMIRGWNTPGFAVVYQYKMLK